MIGAYQQLISNIAEANAVALESEDAAQIILRMRDGDPEQLDLARLGNALYMQFRHGDIAYFMYERGVIDEERLLSTLRPLPLYGETGREFWEGRKWVFVTAYQQYIDGLLAEGFWD